MSAFGQEGGNFSKCVALYFTRLFKCYYRCESLFGSYHWLLSLPSRGIRRDAGGALGRRLSVKQEKENTSYYQRQRDCRDSVVVTVVRPWDEDIGLDSRHEQEIFFFPETCRPALGSTKHPMVRDTSLPLPPTIESLKSHGGDVTISYSSTRISTRIILCWSSTSWLTSGSIATRSPGSVQVYCVWNVMAHAQKPDLVSSVDYWQSRSADQR